MTSQSSSKLGLAAIATLALAALLSASPATAHQEAAPQGQPAASRSADGMGHAVSSMPRLEMPRMDAARGRRLFANKGCVACHSVNGVGGHDATNLDAHTMKRSMNPFDFAAKMWRMAPAMIYAQEEALGEQIQFNGDELADIIAFVHSDEEQHRFSEADLSHRVQMMMHHSHGSPGGGAKIHGEELGHDHDKAMEQMHQD